MLLQLCILRDSICEASFRGRPNVCVELISVYISLILNHIKYVRLKPASGHPAPEMEVKILKMVMFPKKIFCKIINHNILLNLG